MVRVLKIIILILKILLGIVFLLLTVSFIADAGFGLKVKKEVRELHAAVENRQETINRKDLAGLPVCVQRWLENSGAIGKEKIQTVHLKQQGLLRTKEDQPWMTTTAEEYFTVEKPGFIWRARIKAAPFLYIAGRDKYFEGKGKMLIKLLSLVTVVDAAGKELDQGALLRYLAETIWFPTAALSDYIQWEEIDAHSAKAVMSYKGVTASGVFVFNEDYEATSFSGQRYREKNGRYRLETWSPRVWDYKDFNGFKLPAKAEVIWKLKSGDFKWYQLEISAVEFNRPLR